MSYFSRHAGSFIPAYAENTEFQPHAAAPTPVHPRLRGEHDSIEGAYFANSGSSPPTRGTLNLWLILKHVWNLPVHPRLRGEHRVDKAVMGVPLGSSPPTRGTRTVALHCSSGQRFIPAYAGNTAS